MSFLTSKSDFFSLDIGTTAVRLVQLHNSGGNQLSLVKYAYVPLENTLSLSESKADQQKLAQVIKQLVDRDHVSTRNVAVGIPSNRVFTTVVDIDRLPANELAKSIRYQADSLIPTPLAESKIDWALIGDSPANKDKMEILLSSVANNYVEHRLEMLESIGLNVIAFEPDTMTVARALVAPNSMEGQIILDMGAIGTNIIIYANGSPHLTRSITTGSQAIFRAATENLNIDHDQANQYVMKFGLNEDKLEGQAYRALINIVDMLC